MDLLTPGVIKGLIGASSYMKIADVAMGVYSKAKNKGDESTMKRALGYANDSMDSAEKDSKEAQEALKEAQENAKIQAQAEQQAAMSKKAQEAAQAKKIPDQTQETAQTKQQTVNNPTPADTVEISSEGKDAYQGSAQAENVQNVVPQTNTDIPVQSGNTPLTEAKIYTPKGDISSPKIGAKLSASV